MPKHTEKRKHLTDFDPAPAGVPEVYELTSSDEDEEWSELAPVITTKDIDVLELHAGEDKLDEMEISFKNPKKRKRQEEDTIEGLIGDTSRLELKDDVDREKYGWEKLLKAPNAMKILQDGNLLITAGDVKKMMNNKGRTVDQWMKGDVFEAYARLFPSNMGNEEDC